MSGAESASRATRAVALPGGSVRWVALDRGAALMGRGGLARDLRRLGLCAVRASRDEPTPRGPIRDGHGTSHRPPSRLPCPERSATSARAQTAESAAHRASRHPGASAHGRGAYNSAVRGRARRQPPAGPSAG
eukprot:7391237-Prymnesium_polylepis.1